MLTVHMCGKPIIHMRISNDSMWAGVVNDFLIGTCLLPTEWRKLSYFSGTGVTRIAAGCSDCPS